MGRTKNGPTGRERGQAPPISPHEPTEIEKVLEGVRYQVVADPYKDPSYIDNVVDRVACTPLVADRYVLKWNGGQKVVPNDDIDWTKTSKAMLLIGVEPSLAAAQAKAAEMKEVAIKTGYERAVAFYRGEGGAILPTWYSPETTPTTYALIMAVNSTVRAEGQAAERFFRGLRNGMIVAAILGPIIRVFVGWSGGGGGGGDVSLESTPRGGGRGGGRAPVTPELTAPPKEPEYLKDPPEGESPYRTPGRTDPVQPPPRPLPPRPKVDPPPPKVDPPTEPKILK